MVAPEMAFTPSSVSSCPVYWSVYSGFAVLPPSVFVSLETSSVFTRRILPSVPMAHMTLIVPSKPLPSTVKT